MPHQTKGKTVKLLIAQGLRAFLVFCDLDKMEVQVQSSDSNMCVSGGRVGGTKASELSLHPHMNIITSFTQADTE